MKMGKEMTNAEKEKDEKDIAYAEEKEAEIAYAEEEEAEITEQAKVVTPTKVTKSAETGLQERAKDFAMKRAREEMNAETDSQEKAKEFANKRARKDLNPAETASQKKAREYAMKRARKEMVLIRDLIDNIVNYLPLEDALGLSFVSNGWRNLWWAKNRYTFTDDVLDVKREFKLMDGALNISANQISFLSVRYKGLYNLERVGDYILIAISRGATELDLCVNQIPSGVFSSEKLMKLRIHNPSLTMGLYWEVPQVVSLRGLTHLKLEGCIWFDDSLERVVTNCVALKELVLRISHVFRGFDETAYEHSIVSTSLKKIIYEQSYNVVFTTPNVEHFELLHINAGVDSYTVRINSNMNDATFKLQTQMVGPLTDATQKSLVDVLSQFSSVKSMAFCPQTCEILENHSQLLPTFYNLANLKMKLKFVPTCVLTIVESSPKLKTLVLDMENDEVKDEIRQKVKEAFILRHLDIV